MGWYSQGTQVVDFEEHADGTIEFREAAYMIPAHANTWTSAVFAYEENDDGTFTYWGATGDTNLGLGRAAIDVYKVTLPAPPEPLATDGGGGGDDGDTCKPGKPEKPPKGKGGKEASGTGPGKGKGGGPKCP
jgi:hypothetical protein